MTWTVDEGTFQQVTGALARLEPYVTGLEQVMTRWRAESASSDRILVDTFAPSEASRAVLTAALDRAVEEAREGGAAAAGFERTSDFQAYLEQLARLHELFMTDVTRDLPSKAKKPRP